MKMDFYVQKLCSSCLARRGSSPLGVVACAAHRGGWRRQAKAWPGPAGAAWIPTRNFWLLLPWWWRVTMKFSSVVCRWVHIKNSCKLYIHPVEYKPHNQLSHACLYLLPQLWKHHELIDGPDHFLGEKTKVLRHYTRLVLRILLRFLLHISTQ